MTAPRRSRTVWLRPTRPSWNSRAPTSASRNSSSNRATRPPSCWQAIVDEAKRRAEDEGAKIVAAAKAEAQQQSIQAREALRSQVAALAVKGAEQILKREVNAGVHAELLTRLKTEL